MSDDRVKELERLLADANGRIKILESEGIKIQRDARIATEQAQALKNETEASLDLAVQSMKASHAVACGIFGMAQLGRAFMERKVSSMRVVFREGTWHELIETITKLLTQGDVVNATNAAKQALDHVNSCRACGESNRQKAAELALALSYKISNEVWEKITREP